MQLCTTVALVAFLANQIYAQEYAVDCTNPSLNTYYKFMGNGVYNVPDVTDCTKFYKCDSTNMAISSESCAAGGIFNPELGICVTDFDCAAWKQQVCPNDLPGRRNFTSICCNSYFEYSCGNGQASWSSKTCTGSKPVFNPQIRQCDSTSSLGVALQNGCSECNPNGTDICNATRQIVQRQGQSECTFKLHGQGENLRCSQGTSITARDCGCENANNETKCAPLPRSCVEGNAESLQRVGGLPEWSFRGVNSPGWIDRNYGNGISYLGGEGYLIYHLNGNTFFNTENLVMKLAFQRLGSIPSNPSRLTLLSSDGLDCTGPKFSLTLNTFSSILTFTLTSDLGGTSATVDVDISSLTLRSVTVEVRVSSLATRPTTKNVQIRAGGRSSTTFTTSTVTLSDVGVGSQCPFSCGAGLDEFQLWKCDGPVNQITGF